MRRFLPNISLGTVYRNLDVLSKEGSIRKIETCGDQNRFDGDPHDHLHAICLGCGRVKDIDSEFMIDADKFSGIDSEFKITGIRLEILGYCPGCKADMPLEYNQDFAKPEAALQASKKSNKTGG